jgi:hypothetical protein
MFRSACASVLLWGALTASAPAAPPVPVAYEGLIKDVLGTAGTMTLTLGEGKQARDRDFLILEARIKGPDQAEMKVGDLRPGDRVQVEMTADGRLVRVIRVLPPPRAK